MGWTETQAYCANCGNRVADGNRFCTACGRPLENLVGGRNVEVAVGGPGGGKAPAHLPTGASAPIAWGAVEASASVFFAFGVLVAASLAGAGLADVLHSALNFEFFAQDKAVAVWVTVHLTALGIAAIVWFLGVRRSQPPLAAIGLAAPAAAPTALLTAALLTAAVVAASLAVGAAYGQLAEQFGPDALLPDPIDPAILFSGPAMMLSWEALVLVTPLSEEIFFRGFVFAGLAPRFGPRWAITASALVFCAFHLSAGLIIPIFITGVLFAWLYWRTGSLWPCVAAHAAQNAVAVAVTLLWG